MPASRALPRAPRRSAPRQSRTRETVPMPLKVDSLDEPQINLTPMIDVVFNLLIFFMLATRFADMERQFDVQLPTAGSAQPLSNPPDEIVVNVFGDGRLVVGQQPMSADALEQHLRDAHDRYADQAV